jgi:hypothetical protein
MSYFYLVPVIIVFGSFYYFSRSGPTKSLRETYDQHFNTFWAIHGETVGKVFNRLDEVNFQYEKHLLLYRHEGKDRRASVTLDIYYGRPTMFISLSFPRDEYKIDLKKGNPLITVKDLLRDLDLSFDSENYYGDELLIRLFKGCREVIVTSSM